jgi:hypothetical protein
VNGKPTYSDWDIGWLIASHENCSGEVVDFEIKPIGGLQVKMMPVDQAIKELQDWCLKNPIQK